MCYIISLSDNFPYTMTIDHPWSPHPTTHDQHPKFTEISSTKKKSNKYKEITLTHITYTHLFLTEI